MHDAEKLRERIEFIHEQTNSDALVEEYIEGRELYVGVLGNERLRTFPVWEMDFGTLPEVMAGIATRKVKWDRQVPEEARHQHRRREGAARGAPARISTLAKRIYRALLLSGYARIDFRLRPDGSVFVLEANANPNISRRRTSRTRRRPAASTTSAARADHALGHGLPGGLAPDLIAGVRRAEARRPPAPRRESTSRRADRRRRSRSRRARPRRAGRHRSGSAA